MKNIIFIYLIFFSLGLCAQDKKVSWDYPIKPGMEAWQQFKSTDDMYQACQIPEKVLKTLDTESLVNLCLRFPAPPLFTIFNTPQQAFMEYYSNFNGIQELFQRKDAGLCLLKRYAMMSLSEFDPLWPLYKQGKFISHYKFVEAILAQPQIIASLNVKDRKSLMKEAMRKMDEKMSNADLFGGFSIEINLWVIGKLLYSENQIALKNFNRQNIQTAMETGMFVDIDVDALYRQAKNYSHENE